MMDLPVMSGSLVPDLFDDPAFFTPVCTRKLPERRVVGKREGGGNACRVRHCEERSDEAIQLDARQPGLSKHGLLRFARNDDDLLVFPFTKKRKGP
jgi:hypothetical protein